MSKILGIINLSGPKHKIKGISEYRSISATSFLGRYRIIDFQLSNFSNSGIDNIHIHVDSNAKTIIDHVGNSNQYNLNTKKGGIHTYYKENYIDELYNHDINAFRGSLRDLEKTNFEYVVITAGHLITKMNFDLLTEEHIKSGADISLFYSKVDAKDKLYLGLDAIKISDEDSLEKIYVNKGNEDLVNISLETYILSKKIFIEMLNKTKLTSSLFWFKDLVSYSANDYYIRCVEHNGYFSLISNIDNYFSTSMALLETQNRLELFTNDWPIYTKTQDSEPTHYSRNSDVKNSLIANGSIIEGTVRNSIIGRNVTIEKNAVIENTIIFDNSVISSDTYVKNAVIDRYVFIEKTKEIVGENNIVYIRRDELL